MNLSNREKLLLTAAAVITIIYGLNRFLLQPVDQKCRANRERIQTMQARTRSADLEYRLRGQRASQAVSLKKTEKVLDGIVPHEKGGSAVLKLINRLVLAHDLRLTRLAENWTDSQDTAIAQSGLKSYLIVCEAAGEYKDIKAFLKDIENQPRLIIVEKLTIENSSDVKSPDQEPAPQDLVDVSDISRAKFVLRIYYDTGI